MEVNMSRGHRHGSTGWESIVFPISVIDYWNFWGDPSHACDYAGVTAKALFDDCTQIRQMFDSIKCDGIVDFRKRDGELFFQLFELVGVGKKFEDCGREGACCSKILAPYQVENSVSNFTGSILTS